MADFVYTTNPAKIKQFLQTIQTAGVPDKLTIQTLSSMGFKGTNDRPLLAVMKAIGFVGQSGVPTEAWQNYRNKELAGATLAQGIREHYSELYKLYPAAHDKDNEALRNFFGTHTRVSAGTLDFIVRTFKTSSEMADFTSPLVSTTGSAGKAGDDSHQQQTTKADVMSSHSGKPGYTININIQLAIPGDAKPETFDAFFESMKKHLIG